MSESETVLVGTLAEPKVIRADSQFFEVNDWAKRAMWSYLRLQHGRSIDTEIKRRRDEIILEKYHIPAIKANRSILKAVMTQIFKEIIARDQMQLNKPRKIQFIIDPLENKIIAVASLKHLLIPPEEVYDLVTNIIESQYARLRGYSVRELQGRTYLLKEVAGIKFGLQVYGGSITTREAITLSSWVRVELCLNPLSCLGIGTLGVFLGSGVGDFERMLRIKVKADLEPRLRQGIEAILGKYEVIEKRLDDTKKVDVKPEDARVIVAAMALNYQLGSKTVEQIFERFEQEPKTQWGMSMASSWVAAHGDFKKTPEGQARRVEQKLSTIAGATLLIDDMKTVKEKSLGWLKAHVTQGQIKSLDEILKEMKP